MHKILRAKSQEPGASPDLSRPARAPRCPLPPHAYCPVSPFLSFSRPSSF